MFDAKPEDRSALAVVVFPDSFWTEHVDDGNGKLRAVDFAKWGKRGYANHETADKVARLIKSAEENRSRPEPSVTVWDALEPHYKRWKAGQEAITDGYALEGWAGGITKGQIAACKAIHIYSVEDLAKATDPAVEKLGHGSIKLRENARAFVSSLNGEGAKLAKENAEMKAELAEVRRLMEEDRAAMKLFLAQQNLPSPEMPSDVAAGTETGIEKRGPGRPRKLAA